MVHPAIVIPAFKKGGALKRLLHSLARADYPEDIKVKLVISLEKNATPEVKNIAAGFRAENLDITIIHREEQLGLRRHILACGDLSLKYGAIILLEDDLVVDRYFYLYAYQAIKYYYSNPLVAGIALYAWERNEHSLLPFRPMLNGLSTYPMQVPCSLGQCWTSEHWVAFRRWYKNNENIDFYSIPNLPNTVCRWPETSWKKYFFAYLVEKNLFFVYPYVSYTTNPPSPGGTNVSSDEELHQVNMAIHNRPVPQLTFCNLENPEVAYDAFMEPCGSYVYRELGIDKSKVEIDIQGSKPQSMIKNKELVLTSRATYRGIRQYPLSFRPVELNLEFEGLPSNVALTLSKSSDVRYNISGRLLIDLYGYYSGLSLRSARFSWLVTKEFPRLSFESIKRRILKRVNIK